MRMTESEWQRKANLGINKKEAVLIEVRVAVKMSLMFIEANASLHFV